MRAAHAAALLFFASIGLSSPRRAEAYCRTSTCEGDVVGAVCTPAQPSDCGIALYWPTSCVGYSIQKDASSQVDLATVTQLTRQAFDAWQNASCDGQSPSVTAVDLGPVSCDQLEYDADFKNANVIMFRDESWPYTGAVLALTTVTYALDTGKIRDADMELNSAQAQFTTTDAGVQVDLLSILTHEAGHFLGLAHSPEAGATMNADYPPMSTTLRTLEEDDVAGLCAIYPPGRDATCDSEPVNGLGDACSTPPDEETGCSAAGARRPGGRPALALLGAVALLAATRRRAKRRAARF